MTTIPQAHLDALTDVDALAIMRFALSILLVLLLAAPAVSQVAPLSIFAVASSVDRSLTVACVADGTCREANPAIRAVASQPAVYGAVGVGLDAATIYAVHRLGRTKPRTARVLAWTLAAVRVSVVVWNVRQLRHR